MTVSAGMVRKMGMALMTAAIVQGPAACSAHASVAECSTLLDRYVELLVREQDPKVQAADLERQKQATREKARTDPSFAQCPQEVTVKELGCAMRAPNVDEFEKCLE